MFEQDSNQKRISLYQQLKNNKINLDVSQDEFIKMMDDPAKRSSLYDQLSASKVNLDVNKEEFHSMMAPDFIPDPIPEKTKAVLPVAPVGKVVGGDQEHPFQLDHFITTTAKESNKPVELTPEAMAYYKKIPLPEGMNTTYNNHWNEIFAAAVKQSMDFEKLPAGVGTLLKGAREIKEGDTGRGLADVALGTVETALNAFPAVVGFNHAMEYGRQPIIDLAKNKLGLDEKKSAFVIDTVAPFLFGPQVGFASLASNDVEAITEKIVPEDWSQEDKDRAKALAGQIAFFGTLHGVGKFQRNLGMAETLGRPVTAEDWANIKARGIKNDPQLVQNYLMRTRLEEFLASDKSKDYKQKYGSDEVKIQNAEQGQVIEQPQIETSKPKLEWINKVVEEQKAEVVKNEVSDNYVNIVNASNQLPLENLDAEGFHKDLSEIKNPTVLDALMLKSKNVIKPMEEKNNASYGLLGKNQQVLGITPSQLHDVNTQVISELLASDEVDKESIKSLSKLYETAADATTANELMDRPIDDKTYGLLKDAVSKKMDLILQKQSVKLTRNKPTKQSEINDAIDTINDVYANEENFVKAKEAAYEAGQSFTGMEPEIQDALNQISSEKDNPLDNPPSEAIIPAENPDIEAEELYTPSNRTRVSQAIGKKGDLNAYDETDRIKLLGKLRKYNLDHKTNVKVDIVKVSDTHSKITLPDHPTFSQSELFMPTARVDGIIQPKLDLNPEVIKVGVPDELLKPSSIKESLALDPTLASDKLLSWMIDRTDDRGARIVVSTDQSKFQNIDGTPGGDAKFSPSTNTIMLNANAPWGGVKEIKRALREETFHAITLDMLNPTSRHFDEEFYKGVDKLRKEALSKVNYEGMNPDNVYLLKYRLEKENTTDIGRNAEFVAGIIHADLPFLELLNSIGIDNPTAKTKGLLKSLLDQFFELLQKVWTKLKIADDSMLREVATLIDNAIAKAYSRTMLRKGFDEYFADGKDIRKNTVEKMPVERATKIDTLELTKEAIAKGQVEPDFFPQGYESLNLDKDTGGDSSSLAEALADDIASVRSVTGLLSAIEEVTGMELSDVKDLTLEQVKAVSSWLTKTTDLTPKQLATQNLMKMAAKSYPKLTYSKFVQRTLTNLFNRLYNSYENNVFNIVAHLNPVTKEFLPASLKKLKGEYINAEGERLNTFNRPAQIERYKDTLSSLLGSDVEIHYINGYDTINGLEGIRDGVAFNEIGEFLYSKGYVFLSTFGDKSRLPVIKFNKEIDTAMLDKIYDKYVELYKADGKTITPEKYKSEKISNTIVSVLHELRKGNSIQQLMAGKSYITNDSFANTTKRSTLASDDVHMEMDADLIKHHKLQDDNLRPKGVSSDGKDVFAHISIVKAETMSNDQMSGVINKESGLTLKEALFSKYGKIIPDGLGLFVIGRFNEVYYDFAGSLKGGIIKSQLVTPEGIYGKDSLQGVSQDSPIGQWMLANDMGVLMFDTAEKNKTAPYQGTLLFQDKPETFKVKLNEFHKIKESGYAKATTKGLMQIFNGKGFDKSNPLMQKIDSKNDLGPIQQKIIEHKYTQTFEQIKRYEDPKVRLQVLKKMISSGDSFYKETLKLFGEELSKPDSDINLAKALEHPNLKLIFDNKILTGLQDFLSYTTKGSRPIFLTDLGYLNQPIINDIKDGIKWDLTEMNKLGAVPITKLENGMTFLQSMKDIITLSREIQALTGIDADENGDPLTEEDIAKIDYDKNELQTRFESLYKQMGKAVGKTVDPKKFNLSQFMDMTKEGVKEHLDRKLFENIDEKTGRILENKVVLSRDIALKHGTKVGDRCLIPISPMADGMGFYSVTVIGIGKEGSMSPNSMVLPAEFVQRVGKDYDIDDAGMLVQKGLGLNDKDWNRLNDIATDFHNAIVDDFANKRRNSFKKKGNNSLDGREDGDIIGDTKVRKQYLQYEFGSKESDLSLASIGSDVMKIGEIFSKKVDVPVYLGIMQSIMSSMEIVSTVAGQKIDLKKFFDLAYGYLSDAVNMNVDFPKDYTKNEINYAEFEDKMIASIFGIKEGDKLLNYALELTARKMFGDMTAFAKAQAHGTSADLSTLLQMSTAIRNKFVAPMKHNPKYLKQVQNALIEDKTITNMQRNAIFNYAKEFVENIIVKTPENHPIMRAANLIDSQAIKESAATVPFETYRKIEYGVFKEMTNELGLERSKAPTFDADAIDADVFRVIDAFRAKYPKLGFTRDMLVQFINIEQEKGSTENLIKSKAIIPLVKVLFNHSAYAFNDNFDVKKGIEITDDKGIVLKLRQIGSDRLGVKYGTSKEVFGGDLTPKLEEVLYGENSVFKKLENRKKLYQLLTLYDRSNINLNERYEIAVDYLKKQKLKQDDMSKIFTTLLVPYGDGGTLSGRNNFMRKYRSEKGIGYQVNEFLYKLAGTFSPKYMSKYIQKYNDNSFVDPKNLENEILGAPSTQPNFIDDEPISLSRNKKVEALFNRTRDNVIANGGKLDQSEISKLNSFRKLTLKDPDAAFNKIKAKIDSIDLRENFQKGIYKDERLREALIQSGDVYRFGDFLIDIKNNNWKVFEKIYNSPYVSNANHLYEAHFRGETMPSKKDLENDTKLLGGPRGKLLDFYWYLLQTEKSLKKAERTYGPVATWIKRGIRYWNTPSIFAIDNGLKTLNIHSNTDGYWRMNINGNSIEPENFKSTINQKGVYLKGKGTFGHTDLVVTRGRWIEEQHSFLSAKLQDVGTRVIHDVDRVMTKLENRGNTDLRIAVNTRVNEFAEFGVKKLGVTIDRDGKLFYKGKEYANDSHLENGEKVVTDKFTEFANSIYSATDSPVVAAALKLRQAYDVDVPNVWRLMIAMTERQFDYFKRKGATQEAKYMAKMQHKYVTLLNTHLEYALLAYIDETNN